MKVRREGRRNEPPSANPATVLSIDARARLLVAHADFGLRGVGGRAPGAEFEAGRGLQAEAGGGLALFDGRFTGTPNLGWRLTELVRVVWTARGPE